jgi:hypothetical protein
VVKHDKPQSRGKKHSENALLLSSEPSIQEETSQSHLSLSFSSFLLSDVSAKNSKQQRSFLTSTRLFGSSDQPSCVTSKSVLSGFQND